MGVIFVAKSNDNNDAVIAIVIVTAPTKTTSLVFGYHHAYNVDAR